MEPDWLGDLIDLLGVGVAQAAVDSARRQEHDDTRFDPWYDALDAEIAWKRADYEQAVTLANAAWERLPKQEGLLRARLAAVAADAAWRGGDAGLALGWYERALRLDPGVFRRLALAIPARVDGVGEAATAIARSPRLSGSSVGFQVVVSETSACLLTPKGDRIGCATSQAGPEALVEQFHRDVFSLPSQLGRFSMNSLDGTTAARMEATSQQLDEVLEGLSD